MNRCVGCRYFSDQSDEDLGTCRRHAPIPIVGGWENEYLRALVMDAIDAIKAQPRPDETLLSNLEKIVKKLPDPDDLTSWPAVHIDEWCGEFVTKGSKHTVSSETRESNLYQPAGRPIPKDHDAMLFPAEAAYLAAVPVRTLEALRQRGGGPPVSRPGGGRWVRYQLGPLLTWAGARLVEEATASRTRVTQDDIDWAIEQAAIIEMDKPGLHEVQPDETLRQASLRQAKECDQDY